MKVHGLFLLLIIITNSAIAVITKIDYELNEQTRTEKTRFWSGRPKQIWFSFDLDSTYCQH